MVLANKAFGFTPEYTLWELDNQTLNSMFSEHYYLTKKSTMQRDDKGEFEWVEIPNIDGKITKAKKYTDPTNII